MSLCDMLGYGVARSLVGERDGQILAAEPRFITPDDKRAQAAEAVVLDDLHSFVSYAQIFSLVPY
jgi:hypothetical protein